MCHAAQQNKTKCNVIYCEFFGIIKLFIGCVIVDSVYAGNIILGWAALMYMEPRGALPRARLAGN